MKLNLCHDLCCDSSLCKHWLKIVGKPCWIDLFNLTSCDFNHSRKILDVGLSSFDSDEIHHHTTFVGSFTHLIVELWCFLICFWRGAKAAKTIVSFSISANDHLRPCGTLWSHYDWSKNCRAHSSTIFSLHLSNFLQEIVFGLTDGFLHAMERICLRNLVELGVAEKHVSVIKYLRLFKAVADNFNFWWKRDDSDLSLSIRCGHWVDLGWDSLLAKLESVVFFHRSTHIYAEDDWDFVWSVFCSLSSFSSLWHGIILFFFNLGSGLEDIGDLIRLRQLFLSEVYFIAVVAEFTCPDLLVTFSLYYSAILVEGSITLSAELCVSCHKLTVIVLKSFHWYLEYIRVKLHDMSLIWSSFTDSFLSSRLALVIIKITIKVIWVVFFGWIIMIGWDSLGRAIFLMVLCLVFSLLRRSKAEIDGSCTLCSFFHFLLNDGRENAVIVCNDGRHAARRLILLVSAGQWVSILRKHATADVCFRGCGSHLTCYYNFTSGLFLILFLDYY